MGKFEKFNSSLENRAIRNGRGIDEQWILENEANEYYLSKKNQNHSNNSYQKILEQEEVKKEIEEIKQIISKIDSDDDIFDKMESEREKLETEEKKNNSQEEDIVYRFKYADLLDSVLDSSLEETETEEVKQENNNDDIVDKMESEREKLETEGKNSKELFIICKDILDDKSISNEEFSNIMLLIENRWNYLSKKLENFKKNNIVDGRVWEITEELGNIESLESEFLRAKYLQDGKIKLEQSSNVYGPHHIKSLEVKLKEIEKQINEINNSIQHERDIIDGNYSFRETNGVFNATDLANTKKAKGKLKDKLDLYESEKERLNIILQKNDEIINGLTNRQLEDLNEWKNVFMGWFDVLLSTFDVEFKNDKIPIQIKSGQISVDNLKEFLEKKSSNSFEVDKVEFEEEVEYKCSVYDNYKKAIEEFNQWSKANTVTVDLAYLFNELEKEQKQIVSNNARNL